MKVGLIGFQGAGKTQLAKRLSSELAFSHVDTDNLIEPLAGNYRKLVIGDFDFGGKVQDLEFGFGDTEQNLR